MSVRSFLVPALLAAGAVTSLSACDLLSFKEAPKAKTEEKVAAAGDDRQQQACASTAAYDRLKELVFDAAVRVRNEPSPALDQLSQGSIVRMEQPVVRSHDEATGATVCGGRFILELPPGAENAFGGQRRLIANVQYTARAAADGSGPVYNIQGADTIVQLLAGAGRRAPGVRQAEAAPPPEPEPVEMARAEPPPESATEPRPEPDAEPPARAAPRPAPPVVQPRPRQEGPPPAPAPRRVASRPSFNCANGRSRSERMVCGSPGLAALDRQMSSMFYSALAGADPGTRAELQRSRNRFLSYRDRCGSEGCVAQAYRDRMDEIRDIMAGR